MSEDTDSFDNPFQPGGEISNDAEEIVNAFKTGKLSLVSENFDKDKDEQLVEEDENKESIVLPLVRKNAVISVQTTKAAKLERLEDSDCNLVDIETEKKKIAPVCCAI